MSDGRASKSGEKMDGETAMVAVDGTRSMTRTITGPPQKVYLLNSSRLATDIVKRIAVQLELSGTASRADTQLMVEDRIQKLGHEPRNVQVRIKEGEDSVQLIELMDAEGAFLRVEMPAENPEEGTGDSRSGTEMGDEDEEDEALRTQLEEAHAQNKELERQVFQLRTQLDKAQARISELWSQQCAQVYDFDRHLSEAEAEIEHLRAEGSGSRPSTP